MLVLTLKFELENFTPKFVLNSKILLQNLTRSSARKLQLEVQLEVEV